MKLLKPIGQFLKLKVSNQTTCVLVVVVSDVSKNLSEDEWSRILVARVSFTRCEKGGRKSQFSHCGKVKESHTINSELCSVLPVHTYSHMHKTDAQRGNNYLPLLVF